jgi:3-isopropylmalate/(R)-2-methylmalate dehydratase small subunit
MEPFTTLRSRTAILAIADIDTDQLCPARFLTATTREGLGRSLFAEWRHGPAGELRADFALNRPEAAGARVLVAGHNFGCGSSREHAVWALLDSGFRAVVSTGFADIFRSNALKNGLLPVQLDATAHSRLLAREGQEVEIDLGAGTLRMPDGFTALFSIDPFARHCLMAGIDELDFLLSAEAAIAAFEGGRAPVAGA